MIILNIDTSDAQIIKLFLEREGKVVKRKQVKALKAQSEKLLINIDQLLKSAQISARDLGKIRVAHRGDSFTALRIGVLTANALAYALGIEVETQEADKKNNKKMGDYNIVTPKYNSNFQVKIAKNKL